MSGKKVNFSKMKRNEPIFRWTSRRFQSDAMGSELVFAAVKVARHIKRLH